MEITEVRIMLLNQANDRLKAACDIIIDHEFMVRGLKILTGPKGLAVAMPSRKITDRCPKCRGINTVTSRFCSECGSRLAEKRGPRDIHGRVRLFADIAHPINNQCREMVWQEVLQAYEEELKRSGQPDNKPKEE